MLIGVHDYSATGWHLWTCMTMILHLTTVKITAHLTSGPQEKVKIRLMADMEKAKTDISAAKKLWQTAALMYDERLSHGQLAEVARSVPPPAKVGI